MRAAAEKKLGVQYLERSLDEAELASLRGKTDCIINSANNLLLHKQNTGIAGEIVKMGGAAVLKFSDEEKKRWGGSVPVGKAAWTPGGGFKGIVHAVALAYIKDGNKKSLKLAPATPKTVQDAFYEGLVLAAKKGCGKVAALVMCARAGYSTVPADKAPAEMLEQMKKAIERAAAGGVSLKQTLLYTKIATK